MSNLRTPVSWRAKLAVPTGKILFGLCLSFARVVAGQDDLFNVFPLLPATPTNPVLNYVCLQDCAPMNRILPEDIEPASIRTWRFSTNRFAVMFTYTETGAKKMLAFREAHEGQKVRTAVGEFETHPHEAIFRATPPYFRSYMYHQWKEGWLKRRTDKFADVSQDEARKIVAGLQGR